MLLIFISGGIKKTLFNESAGANMEYEAVNPDVLSVDALKARQLVNSVLEIRTLRVPSSPQRERPAWKKKKRDARVLFNRLNAFLIPSKRLLKFSHFFSLFFFSLHSVSSASRSPAQTIATVT